jgi:hypothetical protein
MIRPVAARTGERTGVLVIRVWFEPGAGGGFRARITGNSDLCERDETVTVSSSPEGTLAAVTDWIDAFVGSAAEMTER